MTTADRIVLAALELFDRHGVEAVSMSDVRRAAGVSNGSLYHHFPSKAALVAVLYGRALAGWRGAFEAALATPDSPEQVIKAGVAAHLRWGAENPALGRFALASLDAEPAAAPHAAKQQREFVERVHRWLDEQADAGRIVDLAPRLHYAIWLGPAQEHLRAWLTGRLHEEPMKAAAALGEAAWRALKKP